MKVSLVPEGFYAHRAVRSLDASGRYVAGRLLDVSDTFGRLDLDDIEGIADQVAVADELVELTLERLCTARTPLIYCYISSGRHLYGQIDGYDTWQLKERLRRRGPPQWPDPPRVIWDRCGCSRYYWKNRSGAPTPEHPGPSDATVVATQIRLVRPRPQVSIGGEHSSADLGAPSADLPGRTAGRGQVAAAASGRQIGGEHSSADLGAPSADLPGRTSGRGQVAAAASGRQFGREQSSADLGAPSADLGATSADLPGRTSGRGQVAAAASGRQIGGEHSSADLGAPPADLGAPSADLPGRTAGRGQVASAAKRQIGAEHSSADLGAPSADLEAPSADLPRARDRTRARAGENNFNNNNNNNNSRARGPDDRAAATITPPRSTEGIDGRARVACEAWIDRLVGMGTAITDGVTRRLYELGSKDPHRLVAAVQRHLERDAARAWGDGSAPRALAYLQTVYRNLAKEAPAGAVAADQEEEVVIPSWAGSIP